MQFLTGLVLTLILNSDKTQAIIMGTLRFVKAINLSTLPEIRKQVTNMTNRIHSALYQLKLLHLLPKTLKSKLVISLIYPHVDYCCAVYTDMTTEQNLRLHKAVNACVRFIFNVSTDEHITPYYVRLRWLKTTNTERQTHARIIETRNVRGINILLRAME
ncbi:hypothetical protein ACFW04_014006 [Cataglyphis niger]